MLQTSEFFLSGVGLGRELMLLPILTAVNFVKPPANDGLLNVILIRACCLPFHSAQRPSLALAAPGTLPLSVFVCCCLFFYFRLNLHLRCHVK